MVLVPCSNSLSLPAGAGLACSTLMVPPVLMEASVPSKLEEEPPISFRGQST